MAGHTDDELISGGTILDERIDPARLAANGWVTVVWDDPVNLFSYVIHVFSSYFHYPREVAEQLTMQVHMEGKAVVAMGTREAMERHVEAMHSYGLWATMSRND